MGSIAVNGLGSLECSSMIQFQVSLLKTESMFFPLGFGHSVLPFLSVNSGKGDNNQKSNQM